MSFTYHKSTKDHVTAYSVQLQRSALLLERQTASNASKSTRRSMGSGQILGTTSVNMSSTGNADADDQLKELVYSSPGV